MLKEFNRFGNMHSFTADKAPYKLAAAPFHIIGNTYYAGTYSCSSLLIDTGDGFALLDTPYYQDMGLLIYNIYRLGFDLKDLKYLIVSHHHVDHFGCAAALKHLTGAKIYMSRVDTEYMANEPAWMDDFLAHGGQAAELFPVDQMLEDGELLNLGNVTFKCVLTPGHTVGVMSHFWETQEDGRTYRLGIYGGAGFGALTDENIRKMHLPETIKEDFAASIRKVWDEPVDVMMGNHPFHTNLFDKYFARLEHPETNPFVDPEEWHRYLTDLDERYKVFLSLSPEEKQASMKQSGFYDYVGYRFGID